MIIRSDGTISSSSPPTSAPAPTNCGECGVEELRLLHHVRHRGAFRRLCTSCVLRFHSQLFCPSCFALYSFKPSSGISCSKCFSSSHAECVGSNYSKPYICLLCVNPKSPIFSPIKVKDLIVENPEAANGMNDGSSGDYRVIDKRNAKVLLAAAKISAESMSKAAIAARAEAERRAKEAAFTRKRARVALEHVAYLVAKEKLKKKSGAVAGASVGTGKTGVAGNGSMVRDSVHKSNGAVGSLNPAAMRIEVVKEEGVVGNGVRGDSSSEVVAALNAVDLREKDKTSGESDPGRAGLVRPLNDAVPMDIEENGRMETSAVVKVEESVSNWNAIVFPGDNNQPVKLNDNVSGNKLLNNPETEMKDLSNILGTF